LLKKYKLKEGFIMNLHTTEVQRKSSKKRLRGGGRKSKFENFANAFKIILLLVIVFLLASARAWFNSETEKLNRRAVKVKSKIHSLNRDIANLKIKQEEYSGRYILAKIKLLDLKLNYPRAGQVRRLSITRRRQRVIVRNRKPENLLISQR
jgi:cell division protein FtsL